MVAKFLEKGLRAIRTVFRSILNSRVNYRIYIISGALGLIVIVVIGSLLLGNFISSESRQEVSTADPVDIVLDFYESWLSAAQATDTDPYQLGLAKEPLLSKTLRERLLGAGEVSQDELDPVLCQTRVPSGISARPVYEKTDKAQVLVMSREQGALEQAIVTLTRNNDGWYIDDILCSPGEFPPDREFSFQKEGFLLKSVEPPLDSRYWHLVFEENNEQGHVVPLFFDIESVCINLDGQESACFPEQFTEPLKALVSGEMNELGVLVKRLEFK
ncbi:MAG: YbjP/YqhG family protein [Candidatus Colwellbacteria bacterium]|nr:YbjP/YqhG family protein [Candidatus Colwellbacteria bacterium]